MLVVPCELTEVSSVTPAISPSRFSIGAAMVAAMVCGSAPGLLAWMRRVGKSTAGRLAIGSSKYAVAPSMNRPAASSAVPMGRRMKGAEKFMALLGRDADGRRGVLRRRTGRKPNAQPLHGEVDNRRRVERQQLAQQQAADDGDAERVAQLRADAALDGQWQCAEQRR